MNGTYAYTQEIWPPLAASLFVAALGLYTWRRRDVPAGKPFLAASLFGSLVLLCIALEAAAVDAATKITWYKCMFVMEMLAVTAGTCFTLEYTFPGRWLTRRNLALLALPMLLTVLLTAAHEGQIMWLRLEVGSDGMLVPTYATGGAVLVAYAWSLGLVNAAAFLWLFVHSPQHRQPVALMLFGQLTARAFFLYDLFDLPALTGLHPAIVGNLAAWTTYSIALLGFHILDPLPAARETALAQMREGMIVLDAAGRVASLNPAAAILLNTSITRASGRLLEELLPVYTDVAARIAPAVQEPAEITLRSGTKEQCYAVEGSELKSFQGQLIGHLIMLRDVTEQKRARAKIMEQERALATLRERERLARELHDGVAQTLAAAQMQVKTAKLLHARNQSAQLDACLEGLADTTLEAEADVREYLLGVKTTTAGEHRLFPALREYLVGFTRAYGLPVELTVAPELEEEGLPSTVEVQLLRIVQEALTNVRKHAHMVAARTGIQGPADAPGPLSARVIFSLSGTHAQVTIDDDGCGFDPAAVALDGGGYGLRSMQGRAEAAGGNLAVMSGPGQGTRVTVLVPRGEGRTNAEATDVTKKLGHANGVPAGEGR
jgi:signal transduction histidine kinase